MTISVSSSVSVVSSAVSASGATSSSSASGSSKLVKLANGEYTADSVSKDQTDANKLGLVKEKDGNYGTTSPTKVAATGSTAQQASSGVQSALTSLTLGGE